jgi:DNA-binding response OmpR family regulator
MGTQRGRTPHRHAPHARVLLVEDDRAIGEVVALILGEEGYRVDVARRPADALGVLRRRTYDLVLTDLFGATVESGLAAIRPLAESAAPAPVGICTGHGLSAAAAHEAGYAFLLQKPFEVDDLLGRVGAALG